MHTLGEDRMVLGWVVWVSGCTQFLLRFTRFRPVPPPEVPPVLLGSAARGSPGPAEPNKVPSVLPPPGELSKTGGTGQNRGNLWRGNWAEPVEPLAAEPLAAEPLAEQCTNCLNKT